MNRNSGLEEAIRTVLRPDVYPDEFRGAEEIDEVDAARARQYALLAALLLRAPETATLSRLSHIQGTPTPIGLAQIELAQAASAASADRLQREYFELFIGVGRGELLPYGSYYMTGFLNDRPLARLRADLSRLGLERADGHGDPEDHIGTLCEIMSGFADGRFEVSVEEQRQFFKRHLASWAVRFFTDLEAAKGATFYRSVGTVGRIFMELEGDAFEMDV